MRNKLSLTRYVDCLTTAQHNLKSFSILRIIYGIALLFLLVPSIPERSLLWGEASFWVDPEAKRRGYWTFDALLPKDSALFFDLAFFGFIALAIIFILGWRTRIVTPIMLLMLVALHSNNNFMLNGGDTLMRITLLFMVFANLSEHYSLDARRRTRRPTPPRRLVPAHISNAAHNTGLILCCFQIVVVYTTSGIWKLVGDDWLDGSALFYALRIDNFMLYPAINELLWQSNLVIYIGTFLALWIQTLFVILILWRPTRIFTLISLIFMHLGIGLLLGLWPFSLAMIALDMLFIRDATWTTGLQRIQSSRWYQRTHRVVLRRWREVKESMEKQPTTT